MRSAWIAAVLASLLLHALLLVGARHFAPLAARHGALPPDAEFLPVDLADLTWPEALAADPAAPEPPQPREFTELPADRADTPPARADFLSNVDSRARDLLPGGEDDALPHSEGRAELPQVAMVPGAGAAAIEQPQPAPSAAPPSAAAPNAAASPEAAGVSASSEPSAEALAGEGLRRAEPMARQESPKGDDPLAAFRRFDPSALAAPAPSADARVATPGNADIAQEGLASPDGDVRLLGNVSLNTSAWVYGFWMQRFRRAVEAHWHPPYAFQIGMIKGWTLVALEVSRSGELQQLEVLDEEGHWTLRDASVAAIKAAAPFEPLPADSPEQSIRLQIRMIYTDYDR